MLNFRRLKQDFSSAILKEGRELYDKDLVSSVKIAHLDTNKVRFSARVQGNFENVYESEVEIDRQDSELIDSNCDCAYHYDCQHLVAVLLYIELHWDEMLVTFSKETDLEDCQDIDDEAKTELREEFKEAQTKEVARNAAIIQKESLEDYIEASRVLSTSPFFLPPEEVSCHRAEIAFILLGADDGYLDFYKHPPELQLALRLPNRSKPLHVPHIHEFLSAVRYTEPLFLGGRRYMFGPESFDDMTAALLAKVMDLARASDAPEKQAKSLTITLDGFGQLLAKSYGLALERLSLGGIVPSPSGPLEMPRLYTGSLEKPLLCSHLQASLCFVIECLEVPQPKLFLNPIIALDGQTIPIENVLLSECEHPGLIHQNTYYRFQPHIKRSHLRHLSLIRNMAVPEPLFGTFIENALPELCRFAEIKNRHLLEKFVTLPFAGKLKGRCDIHYLDGELEAYLFFRYDQLQIPAASASLEVEHLGMFLTEDGILARDLIAERQLIETLFEDFIFDADEGKFLTKSEKKIVEFMTEVVPRFKEHIEFQCPENLLDRFIYDKTSFSLSFKEGPQVHTYSAHLEVDGFLQGVKLDLLWDCLSSGRSYVELDLQKDLSGKKGRASPCATKAKKVLVLNLATLEPLVQIFDELGVSTLENQVLERPLWSLVSFQHDLFEGLPIQFSMTPGILSLQQQIMGQGQIEHSAIPKEVRATLRPYQTEGVHWLERLRTMHLNGILADDMGLGKTLQAIIAIAQHRRQNPDSRTLVICPTSLLYNWKEEFAKFYPKATTLVVDGVPTQRKKLLKTIEEYDIVITSYSLLQKDVDSYKKSSFGYMILDEAQYIKNSGTRNAKSVKMVPSMHRLVLTGTPIENSLEELWSLFDFLMPGLLSSYERFIDKYLRVPSSNQTNNLAALRKKIAPFVLRRMKEDVLADLPPITEIVYHCHLSETQQELYRSYAASAREELSKLVKKEGFDKVQIHVLATLTRLKQICCHPAIFAKENPSEGDSAKYEMFMDLLRSLIEGGHQTVVFSQYAKMLQIMREDLEQQGIRFSYLDGTSKNRLEMVKEFNEDRSIPVFLVSLKAGGTGLNLVGGDSVIHYDMWWNPAVEKQATDRVHRLGQDKPVSSYKLVTLNTIEEKILTLQKRKKGLVTQVISSDDDAISKLTWEEVLELLQT